MHRAAGSVAATSQELAHTAIITGGQRVVQQLEIGPIHFFASGNLLGSLPKVLYLEKAADRYRDARRAYQKTCRQGHGREKGTHIAPKLLISLTVCSFLHS